MGDGVGCAKHIRLRIPAHELIAAGKTTLERWERKSETFQAEDISQLTWVRTTVVVPRTTKPERSPNVLSRKLTSTAVSKSRPSAPAPTPQQPRGLGQPRLAPSAEARVVLLTNGPQFTSISTMQTPLKWRQDCPRQRSNDPCCRRQRRHHGGRIPRCQQHERPHTHPRAMEIQFNVNGTISTGMISKNGARFTMAEPEPGILGLSPDIVAATLGDIGVETVEGLDKIIPDNHAIGTDEYLQRCGA
ncbi:hypothetical protein B0H11DRAFT_2222666 [Mycena galericulata]|nr:hypothetical protein B0H11DRAFT_2222666 [Mycena galericulata]